MSDVNIRPRSPRDDTHIQIFGRQLDVESLANLGPTIFNIPDTNSQIVPSSPITVSSVTSSPTHILSPYNPPFSSNSSYNTPLTPPSNSNLSQSNRPQSPRSNRPQSPRSNRPQSPRSNRPQSPRSNRPQSPRSNRRNDDIYPLVNIDDMPTNLSTHGADGSIIVPTNIEDSPIQVPITPQATTARSNRPVVTARSSRPVVTARSNRPSIEDNRVIVDARSNRPSIEDNRAMVEVRSNRQSMEDNRGVMEARSNRVVIDDSRNMGRNSIPVNEDSNSRNIHRINDERNNQRNVDSRRREEGRRENDYERREQERREHERREYERREYERREQERREYERREYERREYDRREQERQSYDDKLMTPRTDRPTVNASMVNNAAVMNAGAVSSVGSEDEDFSYLSDAEYAAKLQEDVVFLNFYARSYPGLGLITAAEGDNLEVVHAKKMKAENLIAQEQGLEKYRKWLQIGYLAIEAFCTLVLGLKCANFATRQNKKIHQLDILLLEMTKRNGVGGGLSSWPVEVRIGMIMITQAIVYILVRMIAGAIGNGNADEIVNAIDGEVVSYVSNGESTGGVSKIIDGFGGSGNIMGALSGLLGGGGLSGLFGGGKSNNTAATGGGMKTNYSSE
ncbi:Hypothetical protein ORPV_1029 [Orpheovirus IHUMI-LCC2]|uniref:Uncharacterized protein n=1 Tax=Orpheovirus IHUMI-LCC2 TaxID=2023057 RepID=A0A2I2L5W8_9VIRU|nr:Hypothetical protein ORPV_1029 [Orpheovirus IHUMI-LCC2]SNW62933.1 Hypothetical protein ORPV_1029 [Orpheovirus IHUMI-LCC2]